MLVKCYQWLVLTLVNRWDELWCFFVIQVLQGLCLESENTAASIFIKYRKIQQTKMIAHEKVIRKSNFLINSPYITVHAYAIYAEVCAIDPCIMVFCIMVCCIHAFIHRVNKISFHLIWPWNSRLYFIHLNISFAVSTFYRRCTREVFLAPI